MKEDKFLKKYYRKVVNALKKDYNEDVKLCSQPTPHLFVGNGGMLCQRTRQQMLALFSRHGGVSELMMIPNKSYSLVSYSSQQCACEAVQALNAYVFDNNDNGEKVPIAPLYLFYLQSLPQMVSSHHVYPTQGKTPHINGMLLHRDIVDQEYEHKLFQFFKHQSSPVQENNIEASLKNRSVKHFGYEFLYGTNNIDRSKPLEAKIPSICTPLLEKMLTLGLLKCMPDQLTINEYDVGQGIPSHVDTHSAFTETIVSVTLGAEVVMDFSSPTATHKLPVILPRRSVLVMSGEARYLWSHGIVPRSHDIYYSYDDDAEEENIDRKYHLTSVERGVRISLTFRKILHEPCQCSWTKQCDSQNESSLYVPDSNGEARSLEEQNVHDVYEEIAPHFSDTRHTAWPRVKDFVCSLSDGSLLADVGCGNGKYLGVNANVMSVGCDRSANLLSICVERDFEVLIADCLSLPYRGETFDATICIAVLHHLSTDERRLEALRELVRITRVAGRLLITVWALEQKEDDVHSMSTGPDDENNDEALPAPRNRIEVSEGRYTFQQQDLLIPWHMKGNDKVEVKEEKVYHRFYHVFKHGELENLCEQLGNIEVLEVYFDKGNWCVVLKKISP